MKTSCYIYRRFGYLQSRLLLDKQAGLRELEEQLDELDEEVALSRPGDLTTRDLRPEDANTRKELMDEIEARFCEYANLMSAAQQLVAANRPAGFEYRSVVNYMRRNHPLQDEELAWIYCKEDLITLRPGREHAWLDYGVEHVLKVLNCNTIEYLFCSPETKQKGDGVGVYYTRSRINVLVISIITLMILVLLVVPVYILYHLVNSKETGRTDGICLGTLLVFTLAFSAVLSLFTKARRHEILGVAAGYCAVLVVFLGNVGNNVTRSS
ncbi:hypothetical protein Vi05172_g6944 [Venturia inaequalis]|nr:hypothetical protein Vi05172_g6944 [Venturia inaequalis]